jgi:hypothetical protein
VIHTATAGDLELLFSCQTQSPVFSLMYWAQFDDPDLNDFAPQWLAHPHIELTPRGLHDEGRIELDVNSATSHFSTFEAHPAKFRASLRRSLQRLRNAMVRTDVGDQAVDLCVGLEALMVPDQGEHRYKLSLRSALLIGDTLRRRMEVKDIVDGLYKVRGATAHGSKKEGKMKVLEADVDPPGMIRRGIPLCAEVFLELLRRGPIDWSQLELNPPPLVTGTLHASTPTAG